MPNIDDLTVKISTQTKNVGSGIDKLVAQLEKLSKQVNTINVSGLYKVSSGLLSMANSLKSLPSTTAPNYNALIKSINSFAAVDSAKLSLVSQTLIPLSNSIQTLGNVQVNTKGIQNLVNALTRLGNSKLDSVQNVDFIGLANNINAFSVSVQGAQQVSSNTLSLVNALARLGQAGDNMQKSLAGFRPLGSAIIGLNNALANAPVVSSETAQMTQALAQLAGIGTTVGTSASGIRSLTTALSDFMVTMSKAPAINGSVVSMTQALANLASQGSRVSSASRNMASGFNSYSASAHKAGKATKSLAYQFGKFYANFWLLIRAFKGIGKMITYASDLTEVQNVVDTTFTDMSYKVEEFSKTSIKQFGMSELALKQYASRFQAMGSAMGISTTQIANANQYLHANVGDYVQLSDSIADVSLNLTKLTADMASFYNVEQKDVAKDLESIYTGMTRPLRAYGLDLTEASLKEFAMSQGLNSNIKAMTQAEKTMLRYQYVLAHTTAAQGDFAKTADNFANQIRILKQQLQQIGGTLGGAFVNMLKPLVKALNNALSYVYDFVEKVVNALGVIFGWKIEIQNVGLAEDEEAAEGLADALGDGAANAKKLKQQLQGFHELNILNTDKDSGSGGGGSSSSGAGGSGNVGNYNMTFSTQDYESNLDTLNKLGEWINEKLTDALSSIEWEKIYESARNFGTGLANFLNGLISPELFSEVGGTIAGALNTVIQASLSFADTFDFYDFGNSIAQGINRFFTDFNWQAYAQNLNTWVDGLWDMINGFFANLSIEDVLYGLFDLFSNLEIDTIITIASIKWLMAGGLKDALNTFLGGELTGAQIGLLVTIGALSFKLGEWLSNNTFIGDIADKIVEWLFDGGDTLNITKTITVALTAVTISIVTATLASGAISAITSAFAVETVGSAAGGGLISSIMGFLGTSVAAASLLQIGLAIAAGIAVGIGAYKFSEENLSPYVYNWLVDSFGEPEPESDRNMDIEQWAKWLKNTGNYDLTNSKDLAKFEEDLYAIAVAYDKAINSGMSREDAWVVAMEKANELGAHFENLKDVHTKYTKTAETNNRKLIKTNTTAEQEQRKALESQSQTWTQYSKQQSGTLQHTTQEVQNAANSQNSSVTSMKTTTKTCTTAMMEIWKNTGVNISNSTSDMGRNVSNTLSTTNTNAENSTKAMSTGVTNNVNSMVGAATTGMTNFKNTVTTGLQNTTSSIDSSDNKTKWYNAAWYLAAESQSGILDKLSKSESYGGSTNTLVNNAVGGIGAGLNSSDNKSKFKTSGTSLIEGLTAGMNDKFGSTADNGGLGVVRKGLSNMSGKLGDSSTWVSNGNDLVRGLINGIENKWGNSSGSASRFGTLIQLIKYLSQNTTAALQTAWNIGSPSKVMRDEVGVWLPLGIGVGIEKSTPALLGTIGDLGKAVNDEMSASIGDPSSLFNGTSNVKATVTASSNGSLSDEISNGITVGMSGSQDRQTRLLQEQNSLLLQILNKETGISADDLFDTVRRKNKAYYEQTGRQALLV